ncbi:DNA-directed DNA polymerase II small subunit [archaeon]|nr:DNA-directed DNA polymerase II small subunit [archaeon]
METTNIVDIFLKCNINLHPGTLSELSKLKDDEIERILKKAKDGPRVITPEYFKTLIDKEEEAEVLVRRPKKRVHAAEIDSEIKIKHERDVTNKSFSQGDIEGFIKYFNNKFERLAKILKERDILRDTTPIGRIKEGEVKIIGMVCEVRNSKKGHIILEVEDPTGAVPVLISNKSGELLELSRNIIRDEVLGIVGKTWKDMVIADEIHFPDLPVRRETKKSEVDIALALISDTHVGSTKFLENEFKKFIKWTRGEIGSVKQRILAEKIKYLIIGGDLVDGVGIYPGQENELEIKDLNMQYERIAKYLEGIPEHIEIIVISGNHDAVRQAEPQLAISEDFAPQLYTDPRIHMMGNPCHASLHGVDVISYHGRSLDDIISTLPNQSYSKPEKAMVELLRKRHLVPTYGGKVPLSPEAVDYMIIDEPPDILHSGHAHHIGVTNYRGVNVINSGTFQEQTSFQKKLNMMPTPARVPIVDLHEMTTTIMRFM